MVVDADDDGSDSDIIFTMTTTVSHVQPHPVTLASPTHTLSP